MGMGGIGMAEWMRERVLRLRDSGGDKAWNCRNFFFLPFGGGHVLGWKGATAFDAKSPGCQDFGDC